MLQSLLAVAATSPLTINIVDPHKGFSTVMSISAKPRSRKMFGRKPRHVANHEEARVHHFIEDRPNLRDQTAFGVGRAGIPG